jgi:hypothetical protein
MESARPQYPLADAPPGSGLADDPALKKLKDAFTEAYRNSTTPAPEFARLLLLGKGIYDPMPWSEKMAGRAFDPWEDAVEPFLVWRVEDLSPRERPFAAVKGAVLAAWRLDRARDLASKDANAILKEWEKQNAPGKAAAFLRDQNRGTFFELTGVARQVPVPSVLATSPESGPYQPYAPPKTDIASPRANFVERLMSLTKEGAGVVLSDRPDEHFYVAVLRARNQPTLDDFLKLYSASARPPRDAVGPTLPPNPLWQGCVEEHWRTYREKFMEELRAEAGSVDAETGKLVLQMPAKDIRLGGGRDSSDSE